MFKKFQYSEAKSQKKKKKMATESKDYRGWVTDREMILVGGVQGRGRI